MIAGVQMHIHGYLSLRFDRVELNVRVDAIEYLLNEEKLRACSFTIIAIHIGNLCRCERYS